MQARRCATDSPPQSGDRIVPSAKRYSVTVPFRQVATDFCFHVRAGFRAAFRAAFRGASFLALGAGSSAAGSGSSMISRMTAEAC